MPTLSGNNGTVAVGGTVVAATRTWSVEITSDTIETTTMGTDVRTYVKGLSTFSGTADIYFDPSEFDTGETIFNPTASGSVGAAPINVKFYVEYGTDGTGTGNDTVFTGSAVVTGYTVNSSMDGMVEGSISFQGSGATTFSTGSNVAP
jgi:hypothetical protein